MHTILLNAFLMIAPPAPVTSPAQVTIATRTEAIATILQQAGHALRSGGTDLLDASVTDELTRAIRR